MASFQPALQNLLLNLTNLLKYLVWIERITQAIANIVDGDDAQEDHQAGEDRQPRIFCEVFLRIAQEISPRRGGRLNAKAKKT